MASPKATRVADVQAGSLLFRTPATMERLIWGYGDGSTLTVLNTSIGNIGAVIC